MEFHPLNTSDKSKAAGLDGCVEKWDGEAGTGDVRTRGLGDSGTRGRGDVGTRGHVEVGKWGLGDLGTRGLGDSGTWRRVFTICLTFHHISQNPRLLIVTALYPVLSSSFVQCETKSNQIKSNNFIYTRFSHQYQYIFMN